MRCVAIAACAGVAGCALGPLPSSDGLELAAHRPQPIPKRDLSSTNAPATNAAPDMADGEFHSTTCEGLALEHRERVTRISKLETAMQGELKSMPTTLVQAFARVGPHPEVGTTSYGEAVAERARLKSNEDAAVKLSCPIETAAKTP